MGAAAEALALKLGIDVSLVEQILEASGNDLSGPTQIVGFARCLNAGCGQYDVDRKVGMVLEYSERRADDLPVVTSSAEHFHLVNDEDGRCPECQEPCALLKEPRRTIPRYVT